MFAAITPALITGAFAERKRFASFVIFTVLWSVLVYSPIAHWVWASDGWLFSMGALDFAGGTVVHASSGVSALVVALLIGRRAVNGDTMEPHDIPMTVLGAGLLWFGWFGFNAGSALAANGLAANALLVTNTAAGAATITWVLASYIHKRKVSVVGAACGAVAGLVAITPASGFVTAGGALVIGLTVGGLCYSATLLRSRLKIDDALDVFAVHGVGGTFGAIATGVFATIAINVFPGLIDGNAGPGRHPADRRRGHDRLRGRRHVRHRQGRRRHPRDPDLRPGRGARNRPLDARRGRLPGLTPSRCGARGTPPGRRNPVPVAGGNADASRDLPLHRRSTTRRPSTTPAASGSSRTLAVARRRGSCRSPSPGSRRSGTAARSARTAPRRTEPGQPSPSSRRSSTG